MIHLIDLALQKTIAPLITQKMVDILAETIAEWKNALVLHNRRGKERILRCGDCGHIWKCVWCDVPLVSHHDPKPHLECHLCYSPSEIPHECPHCKSSKIVPGLPGTQWLEQSLKKLMPNINISRIESDIRRLGKKAKNIVANDTTPSIFISTKSEIQEFLPKISLIIYPLLESDFGLGMYDTGEKIYQEIAWSLDLGQDIVMQTMIAKDELVQDIFTQNHESHLTKTLHERKLYHLPPYARYARITFTGKKSDDVSGISIIWHDRLVTIRDELWVQAQIIHHPSLTKRIGDIYNAQIFIRSRESEMILGALSAEIAKNRNITLDYL